MKHVQTRTAAPTTDESANDRSLAVRRTPTARGCTRYRLPPPTCSLSRPAAAGFADSGRRRTSAPASFTSSSSSPVLDRRDNAAIGAGRTAYDFARCRPGPCRVGAERSGPRPKPI